MQDTAYFQGDVVSVYSGERVRKSGVHTLRHTFSAHNVNNGMPIADLQKVLGHKKKETTLKYIHVVRHCQVVGDDSVTRQQQVLSGRDCHRPAL